MQYELFDLEPQTECEFPQLSGSSGFKYGCRCQRCRDARKKANESVTAFCREPDCGAYRLKGRRYCADHAPTNASLISRGKRSEAICEICDKAYGWYESTLAANTRVELRDFYRRVCDQCRRRYVGAISSHHLDSDQAFRLVTTRACDLCGERPGIDKHGRLNLAVDHDHSCCPGTRSCGSCVRGFLCPGCNTRIGALEKLVENGLDACLDYIGYTVHGRPLP